LPFTRLHFKVLKPKMVFPEPKTLGEHIRKRRLELALTQREAAAQIGTSEHRIVNWENGHRRPIARFLPGITRFLGYDPFPVRTTTIADRLVAKRRELGWSRKRAAREWCIAESTLQGWERGGPILHRDHRAMVAKLLGIPESEIIASRR
jgi:transcriptional regulator with XRE-family HTH domain